MNKKLSFATISMVLTLVFIILIFSTGFNAKYNNISFNENIIQLQDNTLRLVFSSNLSLSDVSINFSINGNEVNNILMTQNGNLWICDISGIDLADLIEYQYTYKYHSLYKNTNWLSYNLI